MNGVGGSGRRKYGMGAPYMFVVMRTNVGKDNDKVKCTEMMMMKKSNKLYGY